MPKRGRPAWKPDLNRVKQLAQRQLNMEQIADALGISVTTLYKHKRQFADFAKAIKAGKAEGLVIVSNKLFDAAADGNTTAQIFIMKAQAGWRDQADPNVNVTVNNNGGSHYSPEAIEARREEAKKLLSYFTLEDKIEYLAMCERARARQVAEEQGQQIAAAPAAEVQAQDASPAVDQLQSANAETDEGGEDG